MKKNIYIGIPTGLYAPTFGIHAHYMEWVSQFGTPILLTPGATQINDVDALLLPGGADVQSNLTFLNTRSNPHLEWFDREELPKYIELKKPIFGICRGFQALNCFFGGSLVNLVGEELIKHQVNNTESDKNKFQHTISLKDPLGVDLKKASIQVNSIHHQAIKPSTLSSEFTEVAVSYHDDIIEAIEHKYLPISGVQWHPEKINDSVSNYLFNKILKQL